MVCHFKHTLSHAYLTEEASYFVSHYFGQDVRCRVIDLPRKDENEDTDEDLVLSDDDDIDDNYVTQ